METNEKIGSFIKTNRENRNISAKELAAMLCVTPSAISEWENGEKLPKIEKVALLSQLFGITIDDFYNCASFIDEFSNDKPKFYNYIIKMKKNNLYSYDKLIDRLNPILQKEIIDEYIIFLKKFNYLFINYLNGKEVSMEKIEKLSVLLGVDVIEGANFVLLNKIDDNFNIDLVLNREKNLLYYEDEFLKEKKAPADLYKKNIYINDVILGSKLDIVTNESDFFIKKNQFQKYVFVKDINGNRACLTEITWCFDLKELKDNYNLLELKSPKDVYDKLYFGDLGSFSNYLLKNINQLKSIVDYMPQHYKNSFLEEYMNEHKKEVEVLYTLLMSGAVFINKDITFNIFKIVCEAIHDNKKSIIINLK